MPEKKIRNPKSQIRIRNFPHRIWDFGFGISDLGFRIWDFGFLPFLKLVPTMTYEEILFDCEERMEKAVNVFRDELRGLRTGRATPALVDSLRIEYYGSATPLKQLAQINTPDPQSILIRPYDVSVLKEIEKAIRSSDLGLSPNNDGKMIRLQVPTMSGEQRQKLVARIKKSAEESKVACRNIRRDANKLFDNAEKSKEMTEDERDQGKEEVQTLLKKFEDRIAEMADKKSKEVTEK
jgi:ribosome recycling factor